MTQTPTPEALAAAKAWYRDFSEGYFTDPIPPLALAFDAHTRDLQNTIIRLTRELGAAQDAGEDMDHEELCDFIEAHRPMAPQDEDELGDGSDYGITPIPKSDAWNTRPQPPAPQSARVWNNESKTFDAPQDFFSPEENNIHSGPDFACDQKLVAQMIQVAETFERDHMPSTAVLLRKAAYRIEKLSRRNRPLTTNPK